MGLGRFGWVWVGLGRFLVCLGRFGWVWVGLGGFGSVWVGLGGVGWVWVGFGGFGSVALLQLTELQEVLILSIWGYDCWWWAVLWEVRKRIQSRALAWSKVEGIMSDRHISN